MRVSFYKMPFRLFFIFVSLCTLLLGSFIVLGFPSKAYACNPCTACNPADTNAAKQMVEQALDQLEADAEQYIEDEFKNYLDTTNGSYLQWFSDDFYQGKVLPALQAFTKQMTSIAMQQAVIIGTFFDAKQQLETQRLYQELQVQAHKDYQPSHDFCTFGTNVRSLAASEELSHFNALALSNRQMSRHLGTRGEASATGDRADKIARWDLFANTYCNKYDNGWISTSPDHTGLPFCNAPTSSPEDASRHNIDIDYTRLIEHPRTLEVTFSDEDSAPTPNEVDIMAMGNNLFGHHVLSRKLSGADLTSTSGQRTYLQLRSVAARRNVAENSFNAIVGLKSSGTYKDEIKTREFLAAILKELGLEDAEIYQMMGNNPSYYAQLEILAKKLYQSPDFFAGLYDKPTNVERKSVALKAIDLMLDRAIYESQMRQEMAMSVLLSTQLQPSFDTISGQLGNPE